MNLYRLMAARAEAGRPVRVGLIGAGKFGAMFLAQARLTRGMHVAAIADLNLPRTRATLATIGWPIEQFAAASIDDALRTGSTWLCDDAQKLISANDIEVIIEATGDPVVGIGHCLATIREGRHIVMVNVEADALAGPLLAQRARSAGVVYSLAWGDQPALIAEHVDWARACGFNVVCAGKGTRYLPRYHQSTPDTVWDNYIFGKDVAERGGMNAKMFNSFIDGSKSGIEMTAVCNAANLTPQPDGLSFPPCPAPQLAELLKPREAGGSLACSGTTEVVSSLNRDESRVDNDLMMGTYVIIEAANDYVRHCFEEYRMLPDSSFHYAALYRPTHMIGLELGISVASVACRNEPTGAPVVWNSDVIATAKRNLKAGEVLDGEGGYCVWGKQMRAEDSLKIGALPLGLASHVKLKRDIAQGAQLRFDDVEIDTSELAYRTRREMEEMFSGVGAR